MRIRSMWTNNRCDLCILTVAVAALATACDGPDDGVRGRKFVLEELPDWGSTGEVSGTTDVGTGGSGGGETLFPAPDLGGGSAGESGGGDEGGGGSTGAETGGDDSGGSSDTGEVCPLEEHEVSANAFEGDDHDGELPPANYPKGWITRIVLETQTQCNQQNWRDTDGVDPMTPGCHQAYDDAECFIPIWGRFGEECILEDFLIETNPDSTDCHPHKIGPNGIGQGEPDVFSCSQFCWETFLVGGTCVTDPNHCGQGIDSAHCQCFF